MDNQKPAKRNGEGKLSRKSISVLAIAVVVLTLSAGIGYPHIALSSYYKNYTNPQPGWCVLCHKKPVSHDAQWLTANHGTAAMLDNESCTSCHESRYCKECHKKKPASHDSSWSSITHIESAREQRQGCYECHPDDYCTACHRSAKQ